MMLRCLLLSLCCCVMALTPLCAQTKVEVVAGTGKPANNGAEGAALATNIGDPFGVEVGPDGALYITEVRHHRIRRLDLATGKLTTVAGTGEIGYSGDGGPATKAKLNEPYEIRFDKEGHLFFVEMKNHIVRRIDAKTGVITTVAGSGEEGFSGDGGRATKAKLKQPHSIAIDGRGGLLIADIGNHRIRRVDLKSGVISTFAGSSEKKLPVEGQVARGNPLLGPRALYVHNDTLWLALREGHSVWKLNLNDGEAAQWAHVAGTGKRGYGGDGGPAKEATFDGPKGIVASDKVVDVVDTENHAIRRIHLDSGKITTLAVAELARVPNSPPKFNRPHGICHGPEGEVYIGDTLNHVVIRITP